MKVITALDFNNLEQAKHMVKAIGPCIDYYKVGLELFVSSGPEIIYWLKENSKKVFLDLKFHDISNTAAQAVSAAAMYGVDMVNIHAQGGYDMMKKCADAVDNVCIKQNIDKPLLIAVTLLTSLDKHYLENLGVDMPLQDYVINLAKQAQLAGLNGVVSSAIETPVIKSTLGSGFVTVTPGIRPKGVSVDDQKRIVTPKDALSLGTDYIVVGRPITCAVDPAFAASEIIKEISINE